MRSLLLSSLALLPALALAQPDASSFPSCLAGLQKKAQAQGISADSYERFTSGLQADLSVLDLLDAQPEFTTPLWDYLAGLVDEQRVSDGKAMLAQHDKLLDRGRALRRGQVHGGGGVGRGKRLRADLRQASAADLAVDPVLLRAPPVVLPGRVPRHPEAVAGRRHPRRRHHRLLGGAFGHTQFMPSTYARIAVDFDGDGRRDR